MREYWTARIRLFVPIRGRSYATPVERTEGAFKRLVEGLESLKK